MIAAAVRHPRAALVVWLALCLALLCAWTFLVTTVAHQWTDPGGLLDRVGAAEVTVTTVGDP